MQWRFYVGVRGDRPPKSCPGPQIFFRLLVELIGSIVISLRRCCLINDEGPVPPNIFPRTAPEFMHYRTVPGIASDLPTCRRRLRMSVWLDCRRSDQHSIPMIRRYAQYRSTRHSNCCVQQRCRTDRPEYKLQATIILTENTTSELLYSNSRMTKESVPNLNLL